MAARKFSNPVQSKTGDTYLLTAQTFSDYADYFAADKEFKEIKKVTDIQPKVREFNWGKAELVHYTSLDGTPLSGILVKPENFDSTKKYPMIIYIYERLSQNFHSFTTLPDCFNRLERSLKSAARPTPTFSVRTISTALPKGM